MYSSPFASLSPQQRASGGLYQQVSVETQLSGATAHQMVAMLFEGYMEAVAQARGAIRAKDVHAKGVAIGRAVRIVEEGLRSGLNLTAGGSLARDLDDLYAYLAKRLTLANLRNDEDALQECQQLVQPLQEAWAAIASEATT